MVGAAPSAADPDGAEGVQVKVWLLGISPIVWLRVLVPSTCTLGELHGVIQVAMEWEGIRLYQFCLRAARYGSWDRSFKSAVPLGKQDFDAARKMLVAAARFILESIRRGGLGR